MIARLYQNSVTMIDLVLNDLSGKIRERTNARLQLGILLTNLDLPIADAFARPTKQRKAAFLGLIGFGCFDDLGI